MFRSESISDLDPALQAEGYTTVFCFPLKAEFKGKPHLIDAKMLAAEDLIFLSAIELLDIHGEQIVLDNSAVPVTVKNADKTRQFRSYDTVIEFTENEIARFLPEEKLNFNQEYRAELRFLIEIDDENCFLPNVRSKLHLFYSMEFGTGFAFGIHSLFSVTLERKNLAEGSAVNEGLFRGIAGYYSGSFLDKLKTDFPKQELEIMAYQRLPNNKLDRLYNVLKSELRQTAFIWHEPSGKYCMPSDIFIVTQSEYQVFRDGFLGHKCLLVIDNSRIRTWLTGECGLNELSNNFIIQNIEQKCVQYLNDASFFQGLYELLHARKINATARCILLTQNFTLVKGNETEIYYQRTSSLKSPKILDESVSFLHIDIKIEKIREEARKYLGLREYNVQNLLDIALKLMKACTHDDPVSQKIMVELLHFLKQIKTLVESDFDRIKEVVFLPVINKSSAVKSWKFPLYSPLYVDDFVYGDCYDGEYDQPDWESLNIRQDTAAWRTFILALGCWSIPAVYIRTEAIDVIVDENQKIVANDRILHIPKRISADLSSALSHSWPIYRQFITSNTYNAKMTVNGKAYGNDPEKIKYSSVFRSLKKLSWLPGSLKANTALYPPGEVIYMNLEESTKTANQVIGNYFPVGSLSSTDYGPLVSDFELLHLNVQQAANFYRLLDFVADNPIEEIKDIKSFDRAYQRILTYVNDFYAAYKYHFKAADLKKKRFLTKHIIGPEYRWTAGEECILIDQQAVLDMLVGNNLLDDIENPYAFTKKGKNDWGRYAKDIGRPISSIIHSDLEVGGTARKFISVIKLPELIIAFVENDLENNFSDADLLFLKEAVIFVHDVLYVTYTYVTTGKKVKAPQPFYTIGDKDKTNTNIARASLNYYRETGQALLEYFEHYTGKELKRLNLLFEPILDTGKTNADKLRYAKDHNLDLARVDYIRRLLKTDYLTEPPEGIGTVINEKDTAIAPPPVFTQVNTFVTEEIQQINVGLNGSYVESLGYIDDLIYKPAEAFIGTFPVGEPALVKPSERARIIQHHNVVIRVELDAESRQNIGMLAEYYVWQKFIHGEPSFIALLGLETAQARGVRWYNEERLIDPSIPDQSVGKGHDLYLEAEDMAIEVKGMIGDTAFVSITGPEFSCMREKGDRYALVIIKHLLKGNDIKTIVILNPYAEIISGNLRFLESKLIIPG
jgi:hypothetical protein